MKLIVTKIELRAMLNEAFEHGKGDDYYKSFLEWRENAIKDNTEELKHDL
jgi:hypothetical protein